MTMNFRSASFAVLSGALMIVGSSMAFANPDQTNPREGSGSAPATNASATNSEIVPQAASVSADSASSNAATDQSVVTTDHDARKDRNHLQGK